MATLIKNKKGIYFTLISILIISVLLIGAISRPQISYVQDLPTIKTRVTVADEYVNRLNEFYIERALYVSSYWALEAIARYENKTGTFLTSQEFANAFAEVAARGTIGGQDIDTINGIKIMNNNTLFHRLGQIENASKAAYAIKTNFTKDLQALDIKIYQSNQTGPWKVGVNATLSFHVDATLAKWNHTKRAQTIFEIKGLHDPMILVQSDGAAARKITPSAFSTWNREKLRQHIINETYERDQTSPSFLGRFSNNLSPSTCCGIETVLNPNKMNLADTDKSYVDWCFYSTQCPPQTQGEIWNITGITSQNPDQEYYAFKLDTYHLVIYNVTLEAYH